MVLAARKVPLDAYMYNGEGIIYIIVQYMRDGLINIQQKGRSCLQHGLTNLNWLEKHKKPD